MTPQRREVRLSLAASEWWRLSEAAENAGVRLEDFAEAVLLRSLRAPKGPHARPEVDAAIRQAHREGLSNSAIARRVGVSRELVRRRIRLWGLETNG